MTLACVDPACLVPIAFMEAGCTAVARQLGACDRLFSSNLLEAELRATMKREDVDEDVAPLVAGISWVLPQGPLTGEMRMVLARGYVGGADLRHLSCGLLLKARLPELLFLTLDERQRALAAELGFGTGDIG